MHELNYKERYFTTDIKGGDIYSFHLELILYSEKDGQTYMDHNLIFEQESILSV